MQRTNTILQAVIFLGFLSNATAGDRSFFNISDLEVLLKQSKPTSMEQLLPLLPESFRTNAVLMRISRSVQGATGQNPRVLLSNRNGSFIAAFNSEIRALGGSSLEMIQFDSKSARFEFAELKFKENEKPIITRNLQSCEGCHGAGLKVRPNWEPFPNAIGAYGELADRILPNSEEELALKSFVESAKSHPRYKNLVNLEETHLARDSHGRMMGKPNSSFGSKITALNALKVAREAQRTPQYEKYRYSILASLYCEKNPDFVKTFFPENTDVPTEFATIEEGSQGDRPTAFFWGFFRRRAGEMFWTTSFGDMFNDRPVRTEERASLTFAHSFMESDPLLRALAPKSVPDKAITPLPSCELLATQAQKALNESLD